MRGLISRLGLATVVFGALFMWAPNFALRKRERPPIPPAGRNSIGSVSDHRKAQRTSVTSCSVSDGSPFASGAQVERVAGITRDYDDITAQLAREFAAVVANHPEGLSTFLQQLALVQREKRVDLAAVLAPQELEDLEMRETPAGHIVQELLGGTSATGEQRRMVFRLQSEFENRFALNFDSTPAALLEKERARGELQEKIHRVLGDELFGTWLAGEGVEFGTLSRFVAQRRLSPSTALELWRAKTALGLRRLEIVAGPDLTREQARAAYDEAARTTHARIVALIGTNVLSADVAGMLGAHAPRL